MKISKTLFSLVLIFCASCQGNNRNIIVVFAKEENFDDKIIPVVLDSNKLVTSPSKTQWQNEKYYVTITLPDSILISNDAHFVSGYVDFLDTRGIRIEPGNSSQYLSDGDTVNAVSSDKMIVPIKNTDPALVEKMKEVLKVIKTRTDSINAAKRQQELK